MNAIVAVNEQWGIGANDALLVSIPPDLKRFRGLTMGGTMIVGRKTLKTFPGEAPPKGRENLVLSRDRTLQIPGAIVCGSVEEVVEAVKERSRVGFCHRRRVRLQGVFALLPQSVCHTVLRR